jgi:hypothetical protein
MESELRLLSSLNGSLFGDNRQWSTVPLVLTLSDKTPEHVGAG